jgi:PAS domain S-box-containing protein
MQFWRLTFGDPGLGEPLACSYDWILVAMSVAAACLGGFAAFAIADRIQAATSSAARRRWLAAGAFALGGGIWAMHFIGMLTFSLPIRVAFDLEITIFSIVPALLGSRVALQTMAQPSAGWKMQQLRALTMAGGVVCMHYVGMEAMRMDGRLYYDPALFVLSIIVGHGLAVIALHWKRLPPSKTSALGARLRPAVLGFAIAGMHYTAMTAARFYPPADGLQLHPGFVFPRFYLAVAVFLVVALITAAALVAVRLDRWLEKTTAALHDTEARERTLLDSLVEGVLAVDGDGVIESANAAAKRMFGVDAVEIEGTSLYRYLPRLLALSPNESPAAANRNTGCFSADCLETLARRPNGTELPVEVSASAYDAEGRSFSTIIVRDISRRKQAESRLRQSQKLESIGQLAAGIAHEINTPTQYLSDNVRFLRDSFGQLVNLARLQQGLLGQARSRPLCPEEAVEHERACADADLEFLAEEAPRSIEESLEGLERIASIVRSLKEFSHPDTEQMTSADLNRAIASTVTIARNEWKYVAQVETDFDTDLPPVACHLGEFNQVILNLIVNSAQAIGGASHDSAEKGLIRVRTKHDNGWVEVRVEDNGPGIPEEIQDRIFDPFFTTKEVGVGTGQGLAIAHGIIVTKHNGSIHVESEPGKGATFIVRLPIAGARIPA